MTHGASPVSGSVVKNPPAIQETQEMWVQSLGQEDPLEKETATHSSLLAWRIPWTEEPWWATVPRVSKSRTRLKRLSIHMWQVYKFHRTNYAIMPVLFQGGCILQRITSVVIVVSFPAFFKLLKPTNYAIKVFLEKMECPFNIYIPIKQMWIMK